MASAVIGALRVNLSADTAEFKRNMTEAERIAYRFGNSIGSSIRKQVLGFGAAVAAAAGPAALGLLIKSSIDTVSAQVDLANRVGASVAAIQTLQHAAELSGASNEALAKTLGTLNARLGEAAREGAGPAYEAIQRLGLSIRELSQMDADERIITLSDRMKELNYTTQQQASTLRDFGVRNQEIINLFQEGSQAIADSRKELEGWGVLLSDVDASKVEQAGDAWDKMWTILQGVGNQIAVRLAPLIVALSNYLGDAATEAKGFGGAIDKAIVFGIRLVAGFNREIYNLRIMVDEAIADFLNLWDAIAGAPPNLLAKIFGGEASDYGFEPINKAYGNLRKTLEIPASDAQWIVWFNNLRKQMDEAAATGKKVPHSVVGDEDEMTERFQKQMEKFNEQQLEKLDALKTALMTETEAEMANYQERLMQLDSFHKQRLVSDQEYASLRAKVEQDHAEKIKEINDDIAKDNERAAQRQREGWFSVANDIGSALESIFGESKAIALAQAIINTAQAITRSLAEYGATPLGLAAAAAAAAAGAAQIATITRTTKSSKGGGGSANFVTPTVPASSRASNGSSAAPGSQQTLFVRGLSASQLLSGEVVREFAQKLIDYQADGGKVVLEPQ